MTSYEFGGAVHHNVGTVLYGAHEEWRAEGVVDYEEGAVAVSGVGNGLKVGDVGIRVAEGLAVDHLRFWAKSGFEGLGVVEVHYCMGDSTLRKVVDYEIVGTAVKIVAGHNVVAGLKHVFKGIGYGCRSRGHCQSARASFENGHTLLEHLLGGVGKAAVDVAGLTECEAVGGMGRVAEHVC